MKADAERRADALDFGTLLRRSRIEAGISQETLAERARISPEAVSALERGFRKAPYRDTVDRLSAALELGAQARADFERAAERGRTSAPRRAESTAAEEDVPHNLPRQLTSFLGRDQAIEDLEVLLRRAPLVTIVGTGGAGKTRVAVFVASRLLGRFASGARLVELAPLTNPDLVVSAIASAIGAVESPRAPLLDTVVSFLKGKQLLLILDNCEHVVEEARRAASAILQGCPEVSILATSREPLGTAGEHVYRIPPLAFPQDAVSSARDAAGYSAVALFVERAQAANAHFRLTDDNASAVAEICRRLDGIPLALELAAARIPMLSPRDLALRLNRRLSILKSGDRSALPRQQTMRALIDWSYELLSQQERHLFDRLSIFSGTFTLDVVEEICGADGIDAGSIFALLTSLADKSLMVAEASEERTRYRLLDSTREYAAEKLAERGGLERLALRHATAYLGAAQRLDRDWYVADEQHWFREAAWLLDEWRAALEWSLAAGGSLDVGRQLAGALARVWYSFSAAEGRRWIRAALATVGADTPHPVVATLHIGNAELCAALGEYAASFAAIEPALDDLARLGDPLQVARAQQVAGSALAALGRSSEGEAHIEAALAAGRALPNPRLAALALSDLGTACTRHGDLERARTLYAEALATYASLRLGRPAASVAGQLAEVEFAAGNVAAALRFVEEAVDGLRLGKNHRSVANGLCNAAAYLVASGRYDEAQSRSVEALAVALDSGLSVLTLFILQHIGAVAALRTSDPAIGVSDTTRAAHLIGYVDARLTAIGARREYTEQQEHDRVLSALRSALPAQELDRAFRESATWPEDRAVGVALQISVDAR